MKKMNAVLIVLSLILVSPFANASEVFNCIIGEQQGTAKIEVLTVNEDPTIKVLRVQMGVEILRPVGHNKFVLVMAQVEGLLSAHMDSDGNISASGRIENSSISGAEIINPELITLSGSKNGAGEVHLRMYDTDQVLQSGFGISVECR